MTDQSRFVASESTERTRDPDGCAMAIVTIAIGFLVIAAFALPSLPVLHLAI